MLEHRIIEHIIVRRYRDNMLTEPFFVEERIDGVVVSTTEADEKVTPPVLFCLDADIVK